MNKTVATSLSTGLFLVIGISGIMMFFNLFDMQVKDLHEILGLVFVLAIVFHLFYNWKSMKNYFNKKVFFASLVFVSIISSVFVVNSLNQPQNPKRVIIEKIIQTPFENSIKVFNITHDKAILKLKKENIKVTNIQSIQAISKVNGISPFKVISILTKN